MLLKIACLLAPVILWAEEPAKVYNVADVLPSALAMTANDYQNLVACARLKMPDLTPDQMVSVAVAIKHAEAAIEAMRKASAESQPTPEPVKAATKP